MKIVFITPAADIRRFKLYRLGGNLYGHTNSITGPLILGGILKRAGHEVEVYEELYKDIDFAKLKDTDIFCFSIMTSNAPRAYFLADRLKKETSAKIIMGGIHASALPEEALEHSDQVITGEGESIILDVIEGRISDKIVHGKCIKNLDEIPFPDYSILKTPCDTANIMSTRGCPFSCSFCTTSRMFYPYRQRSVESVIEELKYYKKLGFKYMNFEDDNFTADKKRTKEICRRMIEENLIFKETFFFGRTDLAKDEELLNLLEKAHLNRVLVGIESLNQKSLDEINKHQKTEDIVALAEALSKHKIRLITSLVLGIDSDTKEDIRKSVAFAKKINSYQLQPAVMTPFPKTPVYDKLKNKDRILTSDWSLFDMTNVTFIPKNMSPWELQKEFFRAAKTFYSFFSSFKIMKIFGFGYGMRRLGLWLTLSIGIPFAYIFASLLKSSPYYKLKHLSEKNIVSKEKSSSISRTHFND